MRWKGRRQSTQVEDRRGVRARRGAAVGGIGTLVLLVGFALLTGKSPLELLQVLESSGVSVGTGAGPGVSSSPPPPGQEETAEFVGVVLADTEDTWQGAFADMGRAYELPRLVLFTDAVESACGYNLSAVGPFYCSADKQVYIDLAFFGDLERRFGAPGDFAQAYVIAHEVGHHVQNVLGISDEVRRLRQRATPEQSNSLSVRVELQADCLAGVWGHRARRERALLEPGDVEEGLAAAAAIGDDRLQAQAGARVQPESWTHGSSEQRVAWFRRGLESGNPDSCDTFGVERL